MSKQRRILEVAKYIVEKKTPVHMCAEHFGYSERTIQNYINGENNLKAIDEELYKEVKRVQKIIEEIGHYVGGKNGNREPKYTDFEAIEIAQTMVNNKMTLDEAAAYFKIPRTTIYDTLSRLNYDEIKSDLKNLFDNNRTIRKNK